MPDPSPEELQPEPVEGPKAVSEEAETPTVELSAHVPAPETQPGDEWSDELPEAKPEPKPKGKGAGQAGKKRGPYNREGREEPPRKAASEPEKPPLKPFDAVAARAVGERLGQMLIGMVGTAAPDFMPQTEMEQKLAGGAIAQTGQFFVDTEMPDLPPGLALTVAWVALYGAMAASARNREKVQGVFTKARMWWAARKARKASQA